MSPIRSIHYFKQSEDNNSFVALNSWNHNIISKYTDDTDFKNDVLPVEIRTMGNGSVTSYQKFSQAIFPSVNYQKNLYNLPYPIAVRAIKDNEYLIERPPFKTTIRISGSKAYKVKKDSAILCEVWIPWTVCVLNLKNQDTQLPLMRMYYNDGPISSLDDFVTPAWTANIYNTNVICLGETMGNWVSLVDEKIIDPENVAQVYNYLINDYFNGGWNLDLGSGQISRICFHRIGKFTNTPLQSSELVKRAALNKTKIIDFNGHFDSPKACKNSYFVWSLMDLPEVLEAVSLTKNESSSYRSAISISKVLSFSDDTAFSESQYVHSINRSLSKDNLDYFSWSIDFRFTDTFIKSLILSDEVYTETFNNPAKNKYNLINLCNRVAYNYVDENKEKFVSFINHSLEKIAKEILNNKNYSIFPIVLTIENDSSLSIEKDLPEEVSIL